ncbi:MAG: hypothetical protein HFJ87_04620 [Muribaculaceae bacterium]|nr:hypothetical protein [Muribaculaceae bacterium]
MNHKLKILFLALFGLLMLPSPLCAGDDGGKKEPIKLNPDRPEYKPRDASAYEDNVTCYYMGGMLYFEFAEPEGRATLSITRLDDGATAATSFMTTTGFTYNIGTAPGTYQLNLSTSRNSYFGMFEIE